MTAPESRPAQPKKLDAGVFQPEISSFRLHLAAEGKAVKTVRTYTEAVQWFAAAHLLGKGGCTLWEQVRKQDVHVWAWPGRAVAVDSREPRLGQMRLRVSAETSRAMRTRPLECGRAALNRWPRAETRPHPRRSDPNVNTSPIFASLTCEYVVGAASGRL
jgi:hypothetical protein